MSRETVSYNATLGNFSAAYLAMWSALQSFDPEADRWAEPADFGSAAQRVSRAREAVQRAHQKVTVQSPAEARKVNEELIRAQKQFERVVKRLQTGEPYDAETRALGKEWRALGSQLADDSVSLARLAGT